MKKILAALLVASFGVGLMAQNRVYDYKASIKRLDAQFSAKKGNPNYVAASYKVASDTIQGYIILPDCLACTGGTIEKTIDNQAYSNLAYLVRKGDKLAKANGYPYVLRTPAFAEAAIFGAYINAQKDTTPLTSIKAANKAWMALEYALPTGNVEIPFNKVLKGYGSEAIGLGFLGLTQEGINLGRDAKIQHTGFGTAYQKEGTKTVGTLCGDVPGDKECRFVKTISGTIVGYPAYVGPCGKTPMWDVCYEKPADVAEDGVISGNWTLKYNDKVTVDYNKATDKEGVILKKLKAAAKDIINVNYPAKQSSSGDQQ
jgi:hypothetical protein